MNFLISGQQIDIESLPCREATELERRQMFGSLATMYEMKVPLLHDGKRFYVLFNHDNEGAVEFEKGTKLEILQSNRILSSVFRRVKRKPKQIWR